MGLEMAKDPPIYTWSEMVDAGMVAGNASSFIVRSGYVYGCSTFILVNVDKFVAEVPSYYVGNSRSEFASRIARRKARDLAYDYLLLQIERDHGGRLPPVGRLRDLESADGINLEW